METNSLTIRPYQLISIIGRLGQGYDPSDLGDPRLTEILTAIKEDPRIPITFRLYEGDRYHGSDEDAPEGVLFHMLRDLEILERLHRESTRPLMPQAGIYLLLEAAHRIPSLEGIWTFPAATSEAWRGASDFSEEEYQRGREKIGEFCRAILPGFHGFCTKEEQAAIKEVSVQEIYQADTIQLFPSHLLYVIAHYGGSLDFPEPKPLDHDNLHEPGVAMRLNPEVKVELVPAHCMVCPPCAYDPEGSGLCGVHPLNRKPAEKANLGQLRILRTLGLEYYEPLPAVELLKRTFERMSLDHYAFTYKGSPPSAYAFARARYAGMGFLDAYDDLKGVIARVKALRANGDVQAILPDAERKHVDRILAQADTALAQGDRKSAYAAVTDPPFWNCWKMYLERVPLRLARLPKSAATEAREQDGRRVITADRADGPIRCDGRLREAPWRQGKFSAGFLTMVERPAIAETAVKALYDEQNIYFGFLCAEKDTSALKAEARTGADLKQTEYCRYYWAQMDDCVLLVLQPEESVPVYFNFIVNTKGIRLGERKQVIDGKKKSQFVYDTDWNAAAHVDRKYWSAEMVIPFRALGLTGKGRRNWRLNFHRFFRNELLDPHSWSYAIRRIDDLEKLGRLTFRKR